MSHENITPPHFDSGLQKAAVNSLKEFIAYRNKFDGELEIPQELMRGFKAIIESVDMYAHNVLGIDISSRLPSPLDIHLFSPEAMRERFKEVDDEYQGTGYVEGNYDPDYAGALEVAYNEEPLVMYSALLHELIHRISDRAIDSDTKKASDDQIGFLGISSAMNEGMAEHISRIVRIGWPGTVAPRAMDLSPLDAHIGPHDLYEEIVSRVATGSGKHTHDVDLEWQRQFILGESDVRTDIALHLGRRFLRNLESTDHAHAAELLAQLRS